MVASGAISLFGSAFSAAAALVLGMVVGRGMGMEGTGLFFQAIAVFTVVTQIARLGTHTGIIRGIAQARALERGGVETRISLIAIVPVTILSLLIGWAMWVWAGQIAQVAASPGEVESFTQTLKLLAPYIAVASISGVLQSVTRMMNSVTAFNMLQNVLPPAARLIGVGLAVYLGWSLIPMLHGWLITIPLWLVVAVVLLIPPVREDLARRHVDRRSVREDARDFWDYTGPRAVSAAFEVGLDWADVLIVSAVRSPVEAGIYAAITRTVKAGQIVDGAMRITVSWRISELLVLDATDKARDLHTKVTRVMVMLTWPFYLTLITMGAAVLGIFNEEARSGAAVLALFGAVMMVNATAGVLQSVLLMGGHSRWQVRLKGLSLSLSIVGNLLFVPRFGLWGAAITWAVMIAIDTALAAWLVHFRMGVAVEGRQVLSAGIAPLLVFGVGGAAVSLVSGSTFFALMVFLCVALPVYAGVLWVFRRRLEIEPLWDFVWRVLRRSTPVSADRAPQVIARGIGASDEDAVVAQLVEEEQLECPGI